MRKCVPPGLAAWLLAAYLAPGLMADPGDRAPWSRTIRDAVTAAERPGLALAGLEARGVPRNDLLTALGSVGSIAGGITTVTLLAFIAETAWAIPWFAAAALLTYLSCRLLQRETWSGRPSGVHVTAVRPGTPAARAGLRPGDLIRRLDHPGSNGVIDLTSADPLNDLDKGLWLQGSSPLSLVVRRGDREVTLGLEVLRPAGGSEAGIAERFRKIEGR